MGTGRNNNHKCQINSSSSQSLACADPMCIIGKLVLVRRGLTFQYKENVGFEFRPVERAYESSSSPKLERWPAAMILSNTHAYFYSFWNGSNDSRINNISPLLMEYVTQINNSLENGCFDLHLSTGLIRLTTVVNISTLNKTFLLSILSATLDYQISTYLKYHDEILRIIEKGSKSMPPLLPNSSKPNSLTSKRGSEIAAKLDNYNLTKGMQKLQVAGVLQSGIFT